MSIFKGDGRRVIEPTSELPKMHSIKVRRTAARQLIRRFVQRGESNHSGMGGLVWVITEFCKEHGLEYRIEGHAGWGYHVRLLPNQQVPEEWL